MNALKEAMEKLGLDANAAAWCLGDSKFAIAGWLRPRESTAHRDFPEGRDVQLGLTEGGRIVGDLSEAAEVSGLDEAAVAIEARRAGVFLRGAVERDAKEEGELLARIVSGRPTKLRFGSAVALIAGELAFLPIGAGRRTILAAADVSVVVCEGGLTVAFLPREAVPAASPEGRKRRAALRTALDRLEARKGAILADAQFWEDADGIEELSELEDEMALRSALLRTLG